MGYICKVAYEIDADSSEFAYEKTLTDKIFGDGLEEYLYIECDVVE